MFPVFFKDKVSTTIENVTSEYGEKAGKEGRRAETKTGEKTRGKGMKRSKRKGSESKKTVKQIKNKYD